MEGGISISENPTFRLTYQGTGEEEIAVKAIDTKDDVFEQTFPVRSAASPERVLTLLC